MALVGVEEGVATALGVLEDEAELLLGLDRGVGGGFDSREAAVELVVDVGDGGEAEGLGDHPLEELGALCGPAAACEPFAVVVGGIIEIYGT